MNPFRRPHKCDACSKTQWVSTREMNRASRVRCSACGGLLVEISEEEGLKARFPKKERASTKDQTEALDALLASLPDSPTQPQVSYTDCLAVMQEYVPKAKRFEADGQYFVLRKVRTTKILLVDENSGDCEGVEFKQGKPVFISTYDPEKNLQPINSTEDLKSHLRYWKHWQHYFASGSR